MLNYLKALDENILRSINGLSGSVQVVDQFMILSSSSELWLGVGAASFFLMLKSQRTDALATFIMALVALGISDLISFEIVKQVVARDRPCWVLNGIHLVTGRCGGSYGFTSNHAANAAAVAVTILLSHRFTKGMCILGLAIASLVGFSRVYLGVHYPGDVLGGFVLGAVIAWLVSKIKMERPAAWLATGLVRSFHRVFK